MDLITSYDGRRIFVDKTLRILPADMLCSYFDRVGQDRGAKFLGMRIRGNKIHCSGIQQIIRAILNINAEITSEAAGCNLDVNIFV